MKIIDRIAANTFAVAFFAVIIVSLIVGWSCYSISKDSIKEAVYNHLNISRDMNKEKIESYFELLSKQLTEISRDAVIIEAVTELKQGYHLYYDEISKNGHDKFKKNVIEIYLDNFKKKYEKENGGKVFDPSYFLQQLNKGAFFLQYQYIMNNPNPIGRKHKLDTVLDGSTYSAAHKKYHPSIRDTLELFGFYDIFLVDHLTGDIIYSTFKEIDFGTSLINGPFSKSKIAEVFNKANASSNPNFIAISDYDKYTPSYDSYEGFMATPIFDGDIKKGILIIQNPIEIINSVINFNYKWEKLGLPKTNELYIVGEDYKMRTINREFFENEEQYLKKVIKHGHITEEDLRYIVEKKSNIGLQKVETPPVISALNGYTGIEIYKKLGVKTISSFTPLYIGDNLKWVLISDISYQEALSGANKIFYRIIIYTIIISIGVIVFASYISAKLSMMITDPITKFTNKVLEIANKKDLTKRLPEEGDEEILEMSKSLNIMLDNIQHLFKQTSASSSEMHAAAQRLLNLAQGNDSSDLDEIMNASDNISGLSDKLDNISAQFKIFEEDDDEKSGW